MAVASQASILPAPPRYSGENTEEYQNALKHWLTDLDRRINKEFHLLRGSSLFLVGTPTSGYGLPPGSVFSNGGVLTLVSASDIWAGGFGVAASVGTVTVTIV